MALMGKAMMYKVAYIKLGGGKPPDSDRKAWFGRGQRKCRTETFYDWSGRRAAVGKGGSSDDERVAIVQLWVEARLLLLRAKQRWLICWPICWLICSTLYFVVHLLVGNGATPVPLHFMNVLLPISSLLPCEHE